MTTPTREDIQAVAQADTPSKIDVPNTTAGLVTWAVGRFGGSAIIAAGLGWALVRIYTDMQVQNERIFGEQKATNVQVMEIARQSTQVASEAASAIRELRTSIEASNSEIRRMVAPR